MGLLTVPLRYGQVGNFVYNLASQPVRIRAVEYFTKPSSGTVQDIIYPLEPNETGWEYLEISFPRTEEHRRVVAVRYTKRIEKPSVTWHAVRSLMETDLKVHKPQINYEGQRYELVEVMRNRQYYVDGTNISVFNNRALDFRRVPANGFGPTTLTNDILCFASWGRGEDDWGVYTGITMRPTDTRICIALPGQFLEQGAWQVNQE